MPNFNVSSSRLHLRPAAHSELSPPRRRMARGPSFEYLSYGAGPREFAARNAAAGSAVALFRQGAEALNEYSLTPWLRNWLKKNESSIISQMDEKGHSAFVVQVNYAVANSFETRVFMSRSIHLLGTVQALDDVSAILTPERLYGPKVDEIPPNRVTRFEYEYLVGQRDAN